VPVLEVDDDSASRPFFTMPLIEGRTLANIVTETRDGNDDWPLVRSLGVLVMVCDAVAREALTYYQRLAADRTGDPRVVGKVVIAHFRIARLQASGGNAIAATTSVAAARGAFAALLQDQQLQDVHRIAMLQL
jgi:hypothetical protein